MIAYQKVILERFMTPRQFAEFEQEYKDHRLKDSYGSRVREANDKDLMILHEYRKGAQVSELRKKYGMSYDAINSSLRVAALSKLR